jgi:zinc metalloprotease ZmpB
VISSRSGRLSLAVIGATALASGLVASPVSADNHTSTTPARVFAPNPVQTTGDQSLTDQKDSAAAVPASAYYDVMLTNLDGSGTLTGDWANIRGENGKPVRFTPGDELFFDRSQDEFEQVMAYYWVTEAQKYIQSLGFGTTLPSVNNESQDLRISQYGIDNSYSWDKHDVIRLGKGGVDDAEDGEVIVHEYGHAVHDSQVPGYGTSLDAGAIGEAFGDYLAVTVGLAVADEVGAPVNANPACVADWDAVSYTSTVPHCLRRVDRDLTVADRRNQVHFDGQIWSRALWDIRGALGAHVADRIIIDAQFDFAPDTSFAAAAEATVAEALEMYGTAEAAVVQQAFEARGIL